MGGRDRRRVDIPKLPADAPTNEQIERHKEDTAESTVTDVNGAAADTTSSPNEQSAGCYACMGRREHGKEEETTEAVQVSPIFRRLLLNSPLLLQVMEIPPAQMVTAMFSIAQPPDEPLMNTIQREYAQDTPRDTPR